ncbi:MAG: DUF2071 domain-containing protein, partial [Armatimonadota bacterium]|nr:DUF2071 domain-containing protein [Armatimonadota bacterium]
MLLPNGSIGPSAVDVDRISPTVRPRQRRVMFQRWAQLLFLHWVVPAEIIQGRLPPGLTLDTYEGKAYVGLVPFTMTGVRPVWAPAVRHLSDFHEINVRTYVHREGKDSGVWFFSLDAANAAAVRLARAWYRLPYHFARMSMALEPGAEGPARSIQYETERLWPGPTPAGASIRYSVGDTPPTPAAPGTLEHFLAERYI